VTPMDSSNAYYGHGHYYYSASNMHHSLSNDTGTTEDNPKYSRRRRQRSIASTSHPTFVILAMVILGSALIIYLKYNGNGDNTASSSVPTQPETTFEQDTVTDEAPKDSRLRGGMSKHERAAAALLLADIIVHAEHDVEEEILKGKLASRTSRLGAIDFDYFLLTADVVPGAGHAYLPYEIDALNASNLAVGIWIKPNNGRKKNRVIWSTLDPGACGGARGRSSRDDIAGMELSIEGGHVTLRYIGEDGSCQAVVGKEDTVQCGEWNHIGMMVSSDGTIGIFRNGSLIGTGSATSRAAHTHSDPIEPQSHRPKGKMSRTFVGQRSDGTDGLDGRVAFLSIWASARRLDDKIMKNHYEQTRRNTSTDDHQDTALLNPALMYPFSGESREGVEEDGELDI